MTVNDLTITKHDVPYYYRPPFIYLMLIAVPIMLIGVLIIPGYAAFVCPVPKNVIVQVSIAIVIGLAAGFVESWLNILSLTNSIMSRKSMGSGKLTIWPSVYGIKVVLLALARLVLIVGVMYCFILLQRELFKSTIIWTYSMFVLVSGIYVFDMVRVLIWYRRLSD
ncbi:hypothetical protein LLG46_10635 [bacterium]|nr:hypothetical protein [bacterium]